VATSRAWDQIEHEIVVNDLFGSLPERRADDAWPLRFRSLRATADEPGRVLSSDPSAGARDGSSATLRQNLSELTGARLKI